MSSSLVCSSQLSSISFGLPLLFFPGSWPSNTVLTKKPWRNTCRNHLFCLFLSVSMSSLLVSTVFSTSSFLAKFTFQMLQSFLCHSFAMSMSRFHTILYTNALTMRFFSARGWGSTHEIFLIVESFLCQSNPTSYFTFTSAVLGHHTSKVAELCDWLQFFTIDHYSQLPTLPPWHLHKFICMLYFSDDCWSASIIRWSPLWVWETIARSLAKWMDCTSTPPTLTPSCTSASPSFMTCWM